MMINNLNIFIIFSHIQAADDKRQSSHFLIAGEDLL